MGRFFARFCLIALLTTHCASSQNRESTADYTKIFRISYERVWRATQQTMLNYPMNVNNMETGHLQTLYITGKHRYKAPHKKEKILPSGYQYRLDIQLLKGRKRTKIIISKQVRMQKNFFSDPEERQSDGFEEKALLYRIQRELFIEKLLKKQAQRETSSDDY